MHSQLALMEHASLNLAPLILLDPVDYCQDYCVSAQNMEEEEMDVMSGLSLSSPPSTHVMSPPHRHT